MGRLKDYLVHKAQEYERDEFKDRPTHSHAYHVYFRGWSERKVLNGNGRGYRIERIYTADYYKYLESDAVWRQKKVGYLLLFLAAVAAFLLGTTSVSALNTTRAIGVAQMLSVLPLIYAGYTLTFQVLAKRLMTIGDYSVASTGMRRGALIAAVALAAMLLFVLVWKFVTDFVWDASDLITMLGVLCSAILLFLLYRLETKRDAVWVKNDNETPYDANEIW